MLDLWITVKIHHIGRWFTGRGWHPLFWGMCIYFMVLTLLYFTWIGISYFKHFFEFKELVIDFFHFVGMLPPYAPAPPPHAPAPLPCGFISGHISSIFNPVFLFLTLFILRVCIFLEYKIIDGALQAFTNRKLCKIRVYNFAYRSVL